MKPLFASLLLAGLLFSCRNQDSYLYEVNPVDVSAPNVDKRKEKTIDQYISILYANLFQKALSANEMVEIRKCIESIGDKELAFEVVISNLMNRPNVILPRNEDMRADPDRFLYDTYRRFFVREPSEAERAYMRNFILSNPNISAEMVYVAFALAEEYRFY